MVRKNYNGINKLVSFLICIYFFNNIFINIFNVILNIYRRNLGLLFLGICFVMIVMFLERDLYKW